MKCYVHPNTEAVATCANCGKAVCENCSINVSGRIVCQRCLSATNVSVTNSPSKQYNPLSVISIILAMLGLLGCLCGGGIGGLLFGIPTAILGYLARKQDIESNNSQSLQLATIALWIGGVEVGLSVVVLFITFALYGTMFVSQLFQS